MTCQVPDDPSITPAQLAPRLISGDGVFGFMPISYESASQHHSSTNEEYQPFRLKKMLYDIIITI